MGMSIPRNAHRPIILEEVKRGMQEKKDEVLSALGQDAQEAFDKLTNEEQVRIMLQYDYPLLWYMENKLNEQDKVGYNT